MTRTTRLLLPCLMLVACQAAPPGKDSWVAYMGEVARLDPQQLLLAREAAVRDYTAQPSDANRLKAGYVLSRAPASPQQLEQSREILAEIPAESELAPVRDLLHGEIAKFTELQEAESRTLELHSEADELRSQVATLQEQLEALKQIETEMIESQEETGEVDQ